MSSDAFHTAQWVDRVQGSEKVGFDLLVGTDIVMVSITFVGLAPDGSPVFRATDEIRRRPILQDGPGMSLKQARLVATACAVGICFVIGGVAPWIDPKSISRMTRAASKLQVGDA